VSAIVIITVSAIVIDSLNLPLRNAVSAMLTVSVSVLVNAFVIVSAIVTVSVSVLVNALVIVGVMVMVSVSI